MANPLPHQQLPLSSRRKLFDEHIERAIKFAFFLDLGIRDYDQDDIKQEVRFAVLEATETYDPKTGPFVTYMLIVVKLHLYDLLRNSLVQKRRAQQESVSIENLDLSYLHDQPDEIVIQREELRAIVKKSKKLTELEKTSLFGVAFGYSYEELPGDDKAIDNAVQRARRKLAA